MRQRQFHGSSKTLLHRRAHVNRLGTPLCRHQLLLKQLALAAETYVAPTKLFKRPSGGEDLGTWLQMNADILDQSGQVNIDTFDAFLAELISNPKSPRVMAEMIQQSRLPGWGALLHACCQQNCLYWRSDTVATIATVQLRSNISAPAFWAHIKERGLPRKLHADEAAAIIVAYANLHCHGARADPDAAIVTELKEALRTHIAHMTPRNFSLCTRAQQLLTHGARAPPQPLPRRAAGPPAKGKLAGARRERWMATLARSRCEHM